jgi:hypothetical protein
MIKRCVATLVVIAMPVFAEPARAPKEPAPVKLDGTFAFNGMKEHVKCKKVVGTLLTSLTRDYRCTPPDPGEDATTSGVPLVAYCKARKGHGEYLVFRSNTDCEKEREMREVAE